MSVPKENPSVEEKIVEKVNGFRRILPQVIFKFCDLSKKKNYQIKRKCVSWTGNLFDLCYFVIICEIEEQVLDDAQKSML